MKYSTPGRLWSPPNRARCGGGLLSSATWKAGKISKRRGAEVGVNLEDIPGTEEWFHRWGASIRYFKRGEASRVRCSLDGGISYEGDTIGEVVQLCDERLQRRLDNTGVKVLRRALA